MSSNNVWIIAGSRHFQDQDYVSRILDEFAAEHGHPKAVLSGAAKGADRCGECWASKSGIPIIRFHADWNKHGKAAGPLRNNQMAEYAKDSGVLFLFWDGKSPGSRSMLQAAQKHGITVHQFITE